MRAFEEREKRNSITARKNNEFPVIEPSRRLFTVVVNNYKQQEKSLHKKEPEEIVETMTNDHQGLPPQPTGYLKFPEYDWF